MKKVFLFCLKDDVPYFNKSMLCRDDIAVRSESCAAKALEHIVGEPPDLLVIRERQGLEAAPLLEALAVRIPGTAFPVLVMADLARYGGSSLGNAIMLAGDVDLAFFNEVTAKLLKLSTRKASRFPKQLAVSMEYGDMTLMATTLNISTTGMLVETSSPLIEGRTCLLRFIHPEMSRNHPDITAKVLREEVYSSPKGTGKCYAIEFEGMLIPEIEDIITRILN